MKAETIDMSTGEHALQPIHIHSSDRQRRKKRASPQEQKPDKDGVLLPGSCPEGVPLEQVPTEIQHLLAVALPEEGPRLLAHLLGYATCTPQQTLPALWATRLEKASGESRALVVVRSLKALASSEGSPCGPDRYHHLLLACEALGILTRQVHRCGATYCTVLSVTLRPTCALTPGIIQTCRQMEQRYANPRVQRLLMHVRMRVQAQLSSSIPSSSPAVQPFLFHMEQLIQHYEQQAAPQAPLLRLIHQMVQLVLENTPFPASMEQEMNFSQPLFEPPASHSSFVQKPETNSTSTQIPTPASMQALNLENSFVPSSSRNLPARDSYLSAEIQTSHERGSFVPSHGRNLPSSLSMNDSFSQERFYSNEASSFIDRSTSGMPELSSPQAPSHPSRYPGTRRQITTPSAHQASNEAGFAASPPGQQRSSQNEHQEIFLKQSPIPEEQQIIRSRNMLHSHHVDAPERATLAAQSTMQKGAYDHSMQPPHTWQAAQSSHIQAQSGIEQGEAYRDARNHIQIRREAALYARLLDGHARWMGKFVQCVQQYPANIRRLAFIDTLSRLYGFDERNRPQRPGAWFCHICESLTHGETQLPELVYQWAETTLDEEQIAASLQQGQQAPIDEREPITAEETDDWASSVTPPSQELMNREMAERLAARISQDVASDSDPSQVEILESRHPGIWQALLIWKRGVEVLLDTEEQWVSYFKRVQDTAAVMKLMKYRG